MKKIRPMYFIFASLLVQFVTIYLVWISVDQNSSSKLMAANVSSVVLIVFAIIISLIKIVYNKRKKIKNSMGLNIIFWFFCLIYIGILIAGFKFLELYPGI
jgi:hypothetical protein